MLLASIQSRPLIDAAPQLFYVQGFFFPCPLLSGLLCLLSLLIMLFGQQQGEVPACGCMPLMKHHVQMLAFVPQVYNHCIDWCLNLDDLSLLLACRELFHELQGKLILYMWFSASHSACYSCYLKEMGQEGRSSMVSTRVCTGPGAVPKNRLWGGWRPHSPCPGALEPHLAPGSLSRLLRTTL